MPPAEAQASAAAIRPPTGREKAAAAGCALLALMCFAYLFAIALGPRARVPLHGDETYFAMCAIRGIASGEVMSGCHDNKGPVISFVYRLVAIAGDLFNPFTLKLAVAALLAVILVLGGSLALRLGGLIGACLFGALLALAVGSNPVTLQLNTDTTGTALVLLAVWVLTMADRLSLHQRAFLAGATIGIALMAKQTFAAYALPAVWWLVLADRQPDLARRRFPWQVVGLFLAALCLPLVMAGLFFLVHGRLHDLFASTFLYAATYGIKSVDPLPRAMAYRLLQVQELFNGAPLTLIGLGFAGWLLAAGRRGAVALAPLQRRGLQLVVGMGLVAFVLLLSAPVLNVRLAITFLVFAALAGGVALAAAAPWRRAPPVFIGLGAVAASMLTFAGILNVWTANSVVRPGDVTFSVEPVGEARGHFGYVYGIWPQFYYFNRMVPASDVLPSLALRGSLRSTMFHPPPPNSWLAAAMDAAWARNERKLMRDFEVTPPAFIVVTANAAPADPAAVRSGVQSLDAYVAERCRFERPLQPPKLMVADYGFAALFRCR